MWTSEILNLRLKNVDVLFELNETKQKVRYKYYLCSSIENRCMLTI